MSFIIVYRTPKGNLLAVTEPKYEDRIIEYPSALVAEAEIALLNSVKWMRHEYHIIEVEV